MGPVLLGLSILMAAGCDGDSPETERQLSPTVVASIFPIGDLAQRLAGEEVAVEVVLPPGASPATFDMSTRQLQQVRGASLFLMIGGGLDEWLSNLPDAAGGSARVVRLSDGITLLADAEPEEDDHGHSHGSGAGNPHIWLDPVLVRDQILPKLEEALRWAFPDESELIQERATVLADSLTLLDGEIREILEPLENRAFIATHTAWTYLAQRYDLVEAGAIHAHPGHEPSSRELVHLMEVAQTEGITCLFTEPQLGEVAARALAAELSLPTCLLDPLGGPGVEGRDDYFSLLRFNARQLADGLGGSGT
jgi:zinc transport system substrate-binding protein